MKQWSVTLTVHSGNSSLTATEISKAITDAALTLPGCQFVTGVMVQPVKEDEVRAERTTRYGLPLLEDRGQLAMVRGMMRRAARVLWLDLHHSIALGRDEALNLGSAIFDMALLTGDIEHSATGEQTDALLRKLWAETGLGE